MVNAEQSKAREAKPPFGNKGIAVLLLAGLAVYCNSFAGVFLLDDLYWLVDGNVNWNFFPDWWTLNIRWVSNRTFVLNHWLDDLNVRGYHALNLAVHLGAALTLFGIIRRTLLLDRIPPRLRDAASGIALAATLIWLVHPLQTQAVDYIIQRHESLMGLFYLLTLYCVLRGATAVTAVRWWYIAAVVSCFLGMGCKEIIVSAPLIVLLYDWIFLADSWRDLLRRRWGLYLGLAATWGHLCFEMLLVPIPLSQAGVGFQVRDSSPWRYLLTQAGVILHYLKLVFWPHPLCFDYVGYPLVDSLANCWPAVLVMLGLVALSIYALVRRSWLGFLGAWFFLILAPTSSIMPLKDVAYEHRMYLPLAAVIVLVVIAGYALLDWVGRRLTTPAGVASGLRVLLVASVAAALGILTFLRNEDYRSSYAMWSNVVAQRPLSFWAQATLGEACRDVGRRDEAIAHLRESMRGFENYDMAYHQLFEILLEDGDLVNAEAETMPFVERNPDSAVAHGDLGRLHWEQGRIDDALRCLRDAIRLRPQATELHYYLAGILAEQGQTEEAGLEGKFLRYRDPDWQHKANLHARSLLLKEGPTERDIRRALFHARLACLDMGSVEAGPLETLAMAYAMAGRYQEAITTAERALKIAAAAERVDQVAWIGRQLRLYREHRPYRYTGSMREEATRGRSS